MFILNASSPSMIATEEVILEFRKVSLTIAQLEVAKAYTWTSACPTADAAKLFSSLLGPEIPVNRVSIQLGVITSDEPVALLGQYTGPRLPEGTTVLPEGANITWWLIFCRWAK
jgi:hypothetical protein